MSLEDNRQAYDTRLEGIRAGWQRRAEQAPVSDSVSELAETAFIAMAIYSAQESAS